MKCFSVYDDEAQVAVIAETRAKAKALALRLGYWDEWTQMLCREVKSPIPVLGPEREIASVAESLEYGFRWNNETMADTFGQKWYRSWLAADEGWW